MKLELRSSVTNLKTNVHLSYTDERKSMSALIVLAWCVSRFWQAGIAIIGTMSAGVWCGVVVAHRHVRHWHIGIFVF